MRCVCPTVWKGIFIMEKGTVKSIVTTKVVLPQIVTLQGGSICCGKVRLQSGQRSYGGGARGEQSSESRAKSLRRSVNAFAKHYATIRNRPTALLSLIAPRDVRKRYEARLMDSFFYEFCEQVKKKYPGCYIIKFYDWSLKGGLHLHCPMRFGVNGSLREKEAVLREIWLDIIEEENPKFLKLTKAREGESVGYLTKPAKKSDLYTALEILKGKRLWGVINKNNISYYQSKKLVLATEEEIQVYREILVELSREYSLPESTYHQLNKDNFALNYLPRDLVKKSYEWMNDWRKSNVR